jgi:hypothetical protein
MNRRSIMTIAAILTTTAAGCASTAGQGKPGLGAPSPSSSYAPTTRTRESPLPIKKTEERYKDSKGFELVLSSDAQGNVTAKVIDPQGTPHDTKKYQLENSALLCFDKTKSDCQVLSFVSDGTFIKLETASCTCYLCGGIAYCFGDTCH